MVNHHPVTVWKFADFSNPQKMLKNKGKYMVVMNFYCFENMDKTVVPADEGVIVFGWE
jgi:hypothetical protein